jgi:hypothetical protein
MGLNSVSSADSNSTQLLTSLTTIENELNAELTLMKSKLADSGNLKREIKESLLKSINEIKRLFEKQKQSVTLASPSHTKTPSYAQITSRASDSNKSEPKTKFVITVLPKTAGTGPSDLKTQLKKKINPANLKLGINSIRNISRGGILMEVTSQKDAEILSKEINDKMGTLVDAKVPSKKQPKIIIYNIPTDTTDTELMNSIMSQNKTLAERHKRTTKPQMEFKFFTRSRNENTKHAVIEVTPEMRKVLLSLEKLNVQFSRHTIEDFTAVTRCYRCLGFGHTSKYCRSDTQKCSLCAGDHSHRDCDANTNVKKCTNCIYFNTRTRNLNLHVNVNHSAMDNKCPCAVRAKNNIISKTDYGC